MDLLVILLGGYFISSLANSQEANSWDDGDFENYDDFDELDEFDDCDEYYD